MSIGHRTLRICASRCPLICASGALGQFPLITKERVEVGVVPSDRRASPRALDTARGGVNTLAGTKAVDPPQTLLLNWRSLWLATD
ncbi:unannotated protein [freshwater metagenome]|uniref:Unannotated protein n=1 Tax=freshwater metagenome TaxID=449393 RepID=A0A6J7SKE2_9ZZZZ